MVKFSRSPVILLLLLLCLTACNETTLSKTTFSPVEYDQAYQMGQRIKFADSGIYMARTSGRSMEPLLPENTVVLIRPIEFDELEAGMIVGYMMRDGSRVIHKLIRRAGSDAWIAKGINNPSEDKERVTRENLLGVLYTVLYNDASASVH